MPSDSDSIEEVVDEAHVVDESVHVAGAQHEQSGQALGKQRESLWLVTMLLFGLGLIRLN